MTELQRPTAPPPQVDPELDDQLDYVRAVARQIHGRCPVWVEYEELVALGELGLVEARHRWREGCGASFLTFAHYRIRGTILDGLREVSRAPKAFCSVLAFEEAADDVSSAAGTDDNLAGLVDRLGAAHLLAGSQPEAPPELAVSEERQLRVREALDALPPETRAILRDVYFEGKSISDLARAKSTHKSTVSRAHTKALAVLAGQLQQRRATDDPQSEAGA